MIYKDNNKDDTTGSKFIIIRPVAITQRGASERYVPSNIYGKEIPGVIRNMIKHTLMISVDKCRHLCYKLQAQLENHHHNLAE